MKLLFVMRNIGYIRNFEAVMREAAARGHTVRLVFEIDKDSPNERPVREHLEALSRDVPQIEIAQTPSETSESVTGMTAVTSLRGARDYLRYLEPVYAGAESLRARARKRMSRAWLTLIGNADRAGLRGALARLLAYAEEGAPLQPWALDLMDRETPDLLCVTPLVSLGAAQCEYVRAATARGIPAVLPVASWDNLTNKGLIHGHPDLVTVWNEAQKAEAVTLHGIEAGHVAVTGAHTYDHWFAATPSRSREAFMTEVGLDPARPYILYLCSSPFIAPEEIGFIVEWLKALRASGDPALREAGVLIRPHPQNPQDWDRVSGDPATVVWPRAGANPAGPAAKAAYYESLANAELAVGINTSALIEAGILGRAVYTLRDPRFSGTQEGTLHFHLLKNVNGGLLKMADSLPEHFAQLSAAMQDPEADRAQARRFIEGFVRPNGLDVAAAPLFVDALEAQLARGAAPRPRTLIARALWSIIEPALYRMARKRPKKKDRR